MNWRGGGWHLGLSLNGNVEVSVKKCMPTIPQNCWNFNVGKFEDSLGHNLANYEKFPVISIIF